jgi:hypothetical protein
MPNGDYPFQYISHHVNLDIGVTPPKKESMKSFYILWAPSGTTPPKVRFTSYEGALKESQRMSEYHQKEFFVMKGITSTIPAPKTITTQLA